MGHLAMSAFCVPHDSGFEGAGKGGSSIEPACANLCCMSAMLSPIVSGFDTAEQEASYDQWFRAKVEEALRSEKPRLPHDVAMAKVKAMLEERRQARANRSVV
jgi:hypothetical protein